MSKPVCCLLVIGLCFVPLLVSETNAKSYPRNGNFKQLPRHKDLWYFIDHNNWYIKAPDKWTHFMGSYALTEVTYQVLKRKTWAGVFALGLGVLKEFDDAYREGWSRRDLYMDVGGVAASILLPDRVKLLAYYDDTTVMFKLSLTVQ